MKPEEALSLIGGGEGQRAEFKGGFAEEDEAIRTLCAFSNAEGGTVFFGVTNEGRVIGVDLGQNTIENFANKLRAQTDPKLSPSIDQLQTRGKIIVAVSVRQAGEGQLFYAFNRSYIRVGKTNQVMSPDEQRARLQKKSIASIPPQLQFQVHAQQAVPSGKYVQIVSVIKNAGQQAAKDFTIVILIPNAMPFDSRAPWRRTPHMYAELETVAGKFLEKERTEGNETAWEDYRLVPNPTPPCYGTLFPVESQIPYTSSSLTALPALRADFHDDPLLPGDGKVLRPGFPISKYQKSVTDRIHMIK